MKNFKYKFGLVILLLASGSAFAATAELTDVRGNVLEIIQVADKSPTPEVLIYKGRIFIGGNGAIGTDHISYHIPVAGVMVIK